MRFRTSRDLISRMHRLRSVLDLSAAIFHEARALRLACLQVKLKRQHPSVTKRLVVAMSGWSQTGRSLRQLESIAVPVQHLMSRGKVR